MRSSVSARNSSSAALIIRSRFSAASATMSGKLEIRSAGANCGSDASVTICARIEASAPERGAEGVRAGAGESEDC